MKQGKRSSRRKFLQVSAGATLGLAYAKAHGQVAGSDDMEKTTGTATGQSARTDATSASATTTETRPVNWHPASLSEAPKAPFLWHPKPPRPTDLAIAFRAELILKDRPYPPFRLQVIGAHWFNLWVNNKLTAEGPARFDAQHPEYEELPLKIGPGRRHCFAAIVQAEGVSTRILRGDLIPPFLWCRLTTTDGEEIPLRWKCQVLDAYAPGNIRINPQLAWSEWCDTRQLPQGWREVGFDDSEWVLPIAIEPKLGPLQPVSIASVKQEFGTPRLIGHGHYRGPQQLHRGSAGEDIVVGLLSRDLAATADAYDGVWRRYDLGQVRLFRPKFRIDAPPGTQVDFLYAETLSRGAVSTLIPLSVGSSCNFDHYVAAGGEQEFYPLAPRGGRYLEVHVSGGNSDAIRFVREEYHERAYFTTAQGAFRCNDNLLNRIWLLGVATLRGCTEDAVTDNPTRERGQWTGDVVTVGMDIMAAAHNDLRLITRGLRQSAWCANPEGVIAGLCPGGETYVSTYALQWIPAVLNHFRHIGDKEFLREMLPYARKNLAAFAKYASGGLLKVVPGTWPFVDWGYAPPTGKPDLALNLHYLVALRNMRRWLQVIEPEPEADLETQYETTLKALRLHFAVKRDDEMEALGYHAIVLGFHAGLWSKEQAPLALAAMKRHILRCFPNDPEAPRLSNSAMQSPRLITPYFAHYALPPFIENGYMDFVLDQYRTCWGWALQDGRTTMVEVFDTNWSHCHQWACCPTWQLSRYVLGLHPRFDLGPDHYLLNLQPGSLTRADGLVPVCDGSNKNMIHVSWTRNSAAMQYRIVTSHPIVVHRNADDAGTRIEDRWETRLTA